MDMDRGLRRLPESSLSRFKPVKEVNFSTFQQSLDIPDIHKDAPSITHSPNLGNYTPTVSYGPIHKYLIQFLLEEESIDGNNPDKSFDPIALRAAENFFHEALCHNPSSPVDSNAGSSRYDVERHDLYNSDTLCIVDPIECKSSVPSDHPDVPIESSSSQTNSDSAIVSQMDVFLSANSVPKISYNDDIGSILQFKKGVLDANRSFQADKHLVIDLDKYSVSPHIEELTRDNVFKIQKGLSADLCRGKKHYHRDESGLEEECKSKHSAIYKEEVELSEVFDKVLLCTDDNDDPSRVGTQQNKRSGRKSHLKKRRDGCEVVDLESLLMGCAQSIAAAEYRDAADQLQKIRQHSSPTGNANQRMANYFADGLEARLAGTGTKLYLALSPDNSIIVEMLKSYLTSWPFMRLSILFANRMIFEVASKGASLHIIDFGILHGIQWPTLIRDLSQRPGGPPKLRITGIELPQPGFRPSQMVEETGCRLAKYCDHFGVPFEYNAITITNWERLKLDDLQLVSGEVIAVNCLLRFKHLLDETAVGADSPRDAVLNLIREVNPHIYMQTVTNGSQNSPFFISRLREALFFYSAIFDLLDATLPRQDNQRLNLEKEVVGREIMNIVACEGKERLQRHETWKQWHSRIMRAGFKPMVINPTLAKNLRRRAMEGYNKDFLFLDDGNWIMQGWKGRILGGSSCWVAGRETHNL
ncbi:unnamed protein product [Cuscuta epithymum]|uniref:Scarecrow-like protein 14 n=2 Tax=Cuscuta epithymum TaxID=186058 RepID=A0AAV0DVL7_9ASTE|nr:unnamed protein product [Cuscuta epithymum]